MFTVNNTNRFFIVFTIAAAILLIISTAQGRSRDSGGRSGGSDRGASAVSSAAQQTPTQVSAPQREVRSVSDSAKASVAERPQVRAEQANAQASDRGSGRSVRSVRQDVAPQTSSQSRSDFGAAATSQTSRETGASSTVRNLERSDARGEQPQITAPTAANTERTESRTRYSPPVARSVEVATRTTQSSDTSVSAPALRANRTVIASPITSVERSVPRTEQTKTTSPTVKTESTVSRTRTEERRRIVTPMTNSAQVAKPPQESKPGVRSENITKGENLVTNTQNVRTHQSEERKQEPKVQANESKTRVVQSPTLQSQGSAERVASERSERREKIVRGTAGREVATPGDGKTMNVERAINAVDGRHHRRTVNNDTTMINKDKPVVNNFSNDRDRRGDRDGARNNQSHDDRDGRWWNRGGHSNYNGHDNDHHNNNDHHNYNDHHSSFFVSLGFYGGYSYYGWAPVVYEPAICTSVAYGPVWPSHYRAIYYGYGPHCAVSYVYPSYHRRYVFMSVGGYWPYYPYARYYWYDCHPWYWYGAEPVAYQVDGGDTNNYYTYNYYGSDNTSSGVSSTGPLTPGTIVNGVEVPDYDALRSAAGRQVTIPPQAAQQQPVPQQPAAPTESDTLFDAGVTAFGDGNYPAAIAQFQRAVRLEPNDVILPFAYAQALFADTDYEQAAAVLHTALSAMAPAKPEVFFPRGLYKDDAVLTEQIKSLERAVMMNPTNSGLQMLYGYQLLGIGKTDEAKTPLEVARRDARTTGPATSLLSLIERIKVENQTKK
jgi:hypothetical protein